MRKFRLADKIKEIGGRAWHPLDVVSANGQIVRIALFRGEYHWHQHEVDEMFYVLKGQMTIQVKGSEDIELNEGEIAVVPKRVRHCPKSQGDSYVLMFEPQELKSSGD